MPSKFRPAPGTGSLILFSTAASQSSRWLICHRSASIPAWAQSISTPWRRIHDGERWTVFHLSIKPRDRWRPTHWALCRHETAEIENLDDRTFLSVKLGNAVPLESVQAAISYVVVPAADDFMTQDDRDTVTLDWAGRAASAVHMAITNTRVHDIQPWTDAFLSNWINAIDRFYFKQSAVYFNGWPLPHPRVRAEADGSTLTEYLNDDGVVVDWDRTTPYTGA